MENVNVDAVKELLGSYGGIASVVVILVGGVKALWKTWIDGKEPVLAFILTYAAGIVAKVAGLGSYGASDFKSWALHLFLLAFVALAAKGLHDGLLNPLLRGK